MAAHIEAHRHAWNSRGVTQGLAEGDLPLSRGAKLGPHLGNPPVVGDPIPLNHAVHRRRCDPFCRRKDREERIMGNPCRVALSHRPRARVDHPSAPVPGRHLHSAFRAVVDQLTQQHLDAGIQIRGHTPSFAVAGRPIQATSELLQSIGKSPDAKKEPAPDGQQRGLLLDSDHAQPHYPVSYPFYLV
jgi:hypothetical protein